MRITVRNEPGAITGLKAEWSALQAKCPHATPWQTWEWNESWWRHFGSHKRLCLLCFYEGGGSDALIGIAPLYMGSYLHTPLQRLAWVGTGPSDYLGVLALRDREVEVVEAMLSTIRERLGGWDIADLQQLAPTTELYRQSLESVASSQAAEPHSLLPMEPCPYLVLPASWEALTARLGKKTRFNLGYYDRVLRKSYPDAEYLMADEQTLQAGMSALFDLHQRRWNARKLPGVFGLGRVQRFHREVAARFLEHGWLRLHLLRLDGEYVSAIYCFAYGGRTYYYLGGFALHLSRLSLGTLLTAQAVRQAITEQHTEFDFLRGREAYKYRWQPDERLNHRLLILGSQNGLRGLRCRAGFKLNCAEYRIMDQAKAYAERVGGKPSKRKRRLDDTQKPGPSHDPTLEETTSPVRRNTLN